MEELTEDEKKAMEQMAKGEEVTLPDAPEEPEGKTDIFDPKNLAAVEELEKFQKKYGKFEYLTRQEGLLIVYNLKITAEAIAILAETVGKQQGAVYEDLVEPFKMIGDRLATLDDRVFGTKQIKEAVRDKNGRIKYVIEKYIPSDSDPEKEEK